MSKNRNFDSVEFFRKVRNEHAAILSRNQREEIIAFYRDQTAPNKPLQPKPVSLPLNRLD